MAISIFIPIAFTVLGLIYVFTIGRITDVIPILGFSDDILVGLIVISVWAIYLLQQLFLSIVTDPLILAGAVLALGGGLAIFFTAKFGKRRGMI